ncbi:uncharacterized protein LOC123038048 [Drosophila rhopaloa]|uniref:Retrovirus-related Pol polyprotein from transposon 17.6 n=1 Tax=Drosophila rhopaloa TaxID=1041015 RepID=A0ABM5JF33_DRORH|nr:uncharacterized protein LOC123038048 [Drosophila rhopaloa]
MAKDSRQFTAFTVPGRGLHSASATFQRALDGVIGVDMEPFAFAYLDDIIVIGATEEQHLSNLAEVFRRLRRANLKVNPKKCAFFRRRLVYLGHVISAEGVQTDPEKVTAVTNLKSPTCLKELRQWLGMASWYRRFVPNFATVVQPMTALLKKGRKWSWCPEQQSALEEVKKRLTTAPVLGCPDFDKTFVLQTDASDVGLGAVLSQDIEGQERVIAYASRRLTAAEGNYTTTEKECLAIIWAIRKMRCYLEGYRFEVVTDHLALKWLNSIESPSGRVARWALELQQFQFDVRYATTRPRLDIWASEKPFPDYRRDFVGPLPRSKHGSTMLLVFHNIFSKWVELIPLRKATAAQVQKAFRERILGRVGIHRKFVCDNGTQFTSRTLKEYFSTIGVEVQYTAPYCPQENPTERTNRTVKTMIAQLTEGDQSSWDELLPEIALAINASVSDSTGYSPAFLTQGREPRLPTMLYDEVTPGSAVISKDPAGKALQLRGIFDIVRSNLQRASQEQARHYNLRRQRRSRSANISQLKPYYSEDFENAAAEEDDEATQGADTRG